MMKKITLLAAVLTSAIAVKAQDTARCDISVQLNAPTDGLIVPYGDTVFVSFDFTNHGPDVLPAGDSVFFVASGNLVLFSKLIQDLPVNGTISMNDMVYYYNPTQDSVPLDVCILHIPQSVVTYPGGGHPATTYLDDNTANNSGCASVLLQGPSGGTGIGSRNSTAENLYLFPNPASDKLQFDFLPGAAGNTLAVVKDITGRVVSSKNISPATGGRHSLDVATLKPGIYFLELSAGKHIVRGRFVIAR